MRASLPSPSTSCAGTIASVARDAHGEMDQPPVRLGGIDDRSPHALRASALRTSRPSCRCRACSCTRPGSRGGCWSACGLLRAAAEGPAEDDHPRQTELVAQLVDGRRDHAEVLGDDAAGRRARARPRGRARLRARAASARAARSCGHSGIAQYETKPRKWSIRATVDELERAPEALDPPAVARRAVRRASRRAGCPSAARSRCSASGGAPATSPCAKSSGHAVDVGAAVGRRRSARRRSAALRARARSAQRPPLALEAHLVGDRASAGEARPVADPVRMARDEVLDLLAG